MPTFHTIVKTAPKAKPSSAFFTAEIEETGEAFGTVGFFKDFSTELKEAILALKIGDHFSFAGRRKMNSYSGKEELVIEGPIKEELSFEEAMVMAAKDLIPLHERTMPIKKYAFPDGNFFYSDGIEVWTEKNGPRKTLNKALVDKYNASVTLQHWFLPNWYSCGLDTPHQEVLH